MVFICVVLLAGLARHEFIVEKKQRDAAGIPEMPEDIWMEVSEVFFYGMIPVVLGGGWWVMSRTLKPIDTLTKQVERLDVERLSEPLPRSGTGDEVDRLTGVFNDLTSRLDASFRQIREFTLHASHELKTPLTVMRAQLETALHPGHQLPTEQAQWIESQMDEVQRLTSIVDSLTLLTRAEAGVLKLRRDPVALHELVEEAVDDARLFAQPHDVTVTLERCDPVSVTGDRHRLRQLLLILGDNAVKYNRPGGTLTVSLVACGAHAELRVENTGEGIPSELQEHIFERFVRGQNARGSVDGCGLGLTIARWIVQAHGGSITLGSASSGITTALVTFPVTTSPAG
jgi:signal transduction histidine kinase